MKTTTININGKDIVLKFGYGFLRVLAGVWALEGPAGVMQKFLAAARPLVELYAGIVDNPDFEKNVAEGAAVEVPFESLDVFVDVVLAAAQNQDSDITLLDKDTVAEFLFENPEIMGEVTKLFMESLPKIKMQENGGKPNPAIVPGR